MGDGQNGAEHCFVRLKNILGFLFENCHAIPQLPFHLNVSQILCPSQDCICLQGKHSISTVQTSQLGREEDEIKHT